jgi:hypothetical protein
MPTAKIPIWLGSNKNVDEYGLGALSAELRDAFIDELQNVRKRPGVEPIISLGTDARIDGVYWWESQGVMIAFSDTGIFQVTRALPALTVDNLTSASTVTSTVIRKFQSLTSASTISTVTLVEV